MLRLSCIIFFLLHAVCIEALCSDSSNCPSCLGGMQSVCFRRHCRCFGEHIPNECVHSSDCTDVCLPGTWPTCPDGKCYCRLAIG